MKTVNLSRRHFLLRQIPGACLLFLVACQKAGNILTPLSQEELSAQTTSASISIADFLSSRTNPIYHPQTDWEFPGGGGQNAKLLIGISHYQDGNFHYLVDGQLILAPINYTTFNPSQQDLLIKRNGAVVYEHRYPRRGTKYIPHSS